MSIASGSPSARARNHSGGRPALRHEAGTWWKAILLLLGLATPLLAFKGALDPFPTYPNNRGVFIAIACLIIPAVWYAILHFTRPEQVRAAARHAVEHHGVPALDEPIPRPAPETAG